MKEAIAHYQEHEPTFKVWIETHQKLPYSHDLLQPLIKPFETHPDNVGVNVRSCQDCIIDMLVWYRKQIKEETKEVTKKK